MATEQREPRLPSSIGPKIYVVVERHGKNAYRARTLPPLKIDELGSHERQLVERVRALLPKKFKKLRASSWSRPLPGNNSQLAPPELMTVQVPIVTTELRCEHHFTIDIEVVYWQIDEKNFCYFSPILDRLLIGKAAHWEGEPIAREFRSEIQMRIKNGGLSYVTSWLMGKRISLHCLHFPAAVVTQEHKKSGKKKDDLPILKKTSSDVRSWIRDPVFLRDELVDQIASLLMSEVPQSVLLVGEPGVGKTALVQHLPNRLSQLPPLWSTGGSQLVSGMCGWGMWQDQLQKLLIELRKVEGILHVGSLMELVEAGKIDDQPGVASLFKPEMQRGKIRIIAECTPDQFEKLESQDPALLQCFIRINVHELAPQENIRLLREAANHLLRIRRAELVRDGHELALAIEPGVIELLETLCRRYCGYSTMPGVPLRLLRSVVGTLGNEEQVTANRMLQAFASHTGLPLFLIDDDEPLDYGELKQRLANRVVGQAEPVEWIANLITTLKSRLQRPEKPLASFLFIGPTGVGKTEMGKALAEVLFGDSNRMVRLDMSEYATPWSIGRLTGIRAADSGTLTGPILDQPFSLILLDEIEKAHPSVFDLLLQVLGEGRLTDTAGRRADFRSSVIIMTSNLGVESFRAVGTGFNGAVNEDYRQHFEREVRRYVRPELLGRIDRIVPFQTLSRADVCSIANRELEKLWQRPGILYGKWIVRVSDEVLQWVAERGYQPQYGARPLRRAIEEHIAMPISRFLVDSNPKADSQSPQKILRVELKENRLHLLEQECDGKGPEATTHQDQQKISAALLDQWRELRYKAMLTKDSADVRTALGNIDRYERQVENYQLKILGAGDEKRRSALIAAQGTLLSQSKSMSDRLAQVEKATQYIISSYPLVLKAFLNGTSDLDLLDPESLEIDLRNALIDLDMEKGSYAKWTFFYLSDSISDFRFLIESHADRFKADSSFWLLYDLKKFAKLKKENKLPRPYKQVDLKTWNEAELVAGFNKDALSDISLEHAVGLAFEATPTRQYARFIENEVGVHFLRKKDVDVIQKLKMRVHVFPGQVNAMQLPTGFRHIQIPSELDPVRQYLPIDGTVVHVPTNTRVMIGAGHLTQAVRKLIDRIQAEAIWTRIGFAPLPVESRASSQLF